MIHPRLTVTDVLMVWHAHMLNPRVYLEDCMRYGLKEMWTAGMPWDLVSNAIDTRFNYTASEDCVRAWENITGRRWDNSEDSVTKPLKCPACSELHEVPWTTCGMPEHDTKSDSGIVGEGYGDGKFSYVCYRCGSLINREFLEVAKFVKDVQGLLTKTCPMPGTILDFRTGLPEGVPNYQTGRDMFERTFPNRLIQRHLRSPVLQLTTPGQDPPRTMESVRVLVEDAIRDQSVIKRVDNIEGYAALGRYRLTTRARISLRKMMSRYWGNSSPFSLELGGAVIRQAIFTEKMHKVRVSTLVVSDITDAHNS
jgi:DNA-directed RNA polymerase subunit RPC12/RpoP